MRMRTTAAIALVLLTSTLWMGAAQVVPTEAAPSNQLGMLRAGIYPGTCANPQPAADVALNPLVPWEQGNEPGSTLVSYTESPIALTELLATPHAIAVTIGGDIDAAVACGGIAGKENGSLTVTLEQENNSGFAGVALLTAAAEGTRITVVIADVLQPPIVITPPSPEIATPVPVDATPTIGDLPGTETPAAETPAIIPVVTLPGRETPTTGTPTPATGTPTTTPPAEQGEVYTSESFGYAIAFEPPWDVSAGPEVDATSDYIRFTNGTSAIDFLGLDEGLTAPVCMDRLYGSIRTLPEVRSIITHDGAPTDELTTTTERAAEVWDVTYQTETGQVLDSTLYLECLVLDPGESILVTTHESPSDQYPAEAAQREEFYAGVTLPAGRRMR